MLTQYQALPPIWITPVWLLASGLALALFIFVRRKMGFASNHNYVIPDYRKWRNEAMVQVVGVSYTNEKVDVDSKEFVNCVFENATLWYEGTGPWKLTTCQFRGSVMAKTSNVGAGGFADLGENLKLMARQTGAHTVEYGTMDEKGQSLRKIVSEKYTPIKPKPNNPTEKG